MKLPNVTKHFNILFPQFLAGVNRLYLEGDDKHKVSYDYAFLSLFKDDVKVVVDHIMHGSEITIESVNPPIKMTVSTLMNFSRLQQN